jgi:hypothetical protein
VNPADGASEVTLGEQLEPEVRGANDLGNGQRRWMIL